MSRVKTGGMQKGYKYSKKRLWYNNGTIETLLFEDDTIPTGYVRGRLKTGKTWNKGLTKYTNSSMAKVSEKMKRKGDEYFGTRYDYLVNRFFNNNEFIEYYKSHLCYECLTQFNISWDDLHIIIDLLGLESPQQHIISLKDYIYDDKYKKRHSDTLKGKNTWSKGKKRSLSEIERQKISWSKRTNEQHKEAKYKEYLTRKANNTLGQHKTHDELLLEKILIEYFGNENVIYNYYDKERYPFKCDFYIVPEDLFIELHAGWEHQSHPFNNDNENDVALLEELKLKSINSDYYKNVIYQWTELDVKKLNTFKNNKLNYIIGYSVEEVCDELFKNKIDN